MTPALILAAAPTPWATYAAATLASGLVAATVVLWRGRVRSLAAHERAFATLEKARWVADPREFATLVSGAVRRYVEERFGVPAERRTTAEVLEAGAFASLGELFDFSDRAKFGGFLLAPAEMEGMHACAWGFVATTRPAESARLNRTVVRGKLGELRKQQEQKQQQSQQDRQNQQHDSQQQGQQAGEGQQDRQQGAGEQKDPQQDGQSQQRDEQQAGHEGQQHEDRQQAGQRPENQRHTRHGRNL